MTEQKRKTFRYSVDLAAFALSPLSQIRVSLAEHELQLLNVSQGGLAILWDHKLSLPLPEVGARINLSLEILGKAFPAEVLLCAVRGFRVSCSFVESDGAFATALRDFLNLKYCAQTLVPLSAFKNLETVQDLVAGSESFEAFVGEKDTGVFVWMGSSRELLRLIVAVGALVMEWRPVKGWASGQRAGDSAVSIDDGILWDQSVKEQTQNLMTDLLLSWLPQGQGRDFLAQLEGGTSVFFPVLRYPEDV